MYVREIQLWVLLPLPLTALGQHAETMCPIEGLCAHQV